MTTLLHSAKHHWLYLDESGDIGAATRAGMHIVAIVVAEPDVLRRVMIATRKQFPKAFHSARGYKAEGADIRVTAFLLRELSKADCAIIIVRVSAAAIKHYADLNTLYIDAAVVAITTAWERYPNTKPILHRRYYQPSLTHAITNRLLNEARDRGIALHAQDIEQRAGGAQEYGLQIADAVAWSYTQARRGKLRTAKLFEYVRDQVVALLDFKGK